MLEDIKLLLGDNSSFSDALIGLMLKQSIQEVSSYCNRNIDFELEPIVERITIIKLNRLNSEGLQAQNLSGVSESYIDGYPADIQQILNRKRKIKIL